MTVTPPGSSTVTLTTGSNSKTKSTVSTVSCAKVKDTVSCSDVMRTDSTTKRIEYNFGEAARVSYGKAIGTYLTRPPHHTFRTQIGTFDYSLTLLVQL